MLEAGAIVRWEGGGAGWLSPSLCRRERDEKEELPLEFSHRILLNPRMLSCSLNPVPNGTQLASLKAEIHCFARGVSHYAMTFCFVEY